MGPRRRALPRHLGPALAALGALALAAAGPPPALRGAIKTLIAEAQRHLEDPDALPEAPDHSARSVPQIDPEPLIDALTRRAHQDPFTDAYVRWQLTSHDPALSGLDQARFVRLVREAPVLVPNPRADPQVVALFERVADAGPLAETDLKRFRRILERLEAQTARAQTLGRPARGFHEWAQRRLAADALRSRQWQLVTLAATVSAGWPVADLKSKVTQTLGAAASGAALTPSQRGLLARQLRALRGLERRTVNQVTFMADGSVRVTFATSRIGDDDIDRWLERLGPV